MARDDGNSRLLEARQLMSALPPKADIDGYLPNVRFVPSKHLREQKKNRTIYPTRAFCEGTVTTSSARNDQPQEQGK
jgi:hypothetical protein